MKIARQKLSFLIAALSLIAFVSGNMVGQHGWYAFWKTVLGKEDESLIAYVGFVPPIEKVPNYAKWSQYGGDVRTHTYRQVPSDVLVPLPRYDEIGLRNGTADPFTKQVYSVGHLGDYNDGADHGGSHVGIDIAVPLMTPVNSIGNGIVMKVSMQSYGYGHHVLIKHPNVPDPKNPGKTTSVWSTYAHLDSILVVEGQVVHKGEQIGTSGQTGFAYGSHLHFQVDNDDAPFHPYWPFTTAEAQSAHLNFDQAINAGLHQERGEQYTISPMVLVQSSPAGSAIATTKSVPTSSVVASVVARPLTPAERRSARLLKANATTVSTLRSTPAVVATVQNATAVTATPVRVADASPDVLPTPYAGVSSTDVDAIKFQHSGKLSHTWQKVKVLAMNRSGEVVTSPLFSGKIYLISSFGDAEIRPSELTSANFVSGVATVNVLTRGTKTSIISARGAFVADSAPFVYER